MTYWGHKWGGTWGLGSADEEVCQGGYDQDALKDTLFLSSDSLILNIDNPTADTWE